MYWSHTFSELKRNMDIMHRKFLDGFWAVISIRLLLEETKFIPKTDHHTLRCNLNLAYTTKKIAKWRLQVFGLESKSFYGACVKHQDADGLLWLFASRAGDRGIDDGISMFPVQEHFREKEHQLPCCCPNHEDSTTLRQFNAYVVCSFWRKSAVRETTCASNSQNSVWRSFFNSRRLELVAWRRPRS